MSITKSQKAHFSGCPAVNARTLGNTTSVIHIISGTGPYMQYSSSSGKCSRSFLNCHVQGLHVQLRQSPGGTALPCHNPEASSLLPPSRFPFLYHSLLLPCCLHSIFPSPAPRSHPGTRLFPIIIVEYCISLVLKV